MIDFPLRLEDVGAGEIRAGGTDLTDRRKRGIASGPVEDLRDVDGHDTIDVSASLTIGARARIVSVATHADVRARWPALAEAAGTLATPQIRAVATVGGNLLQRSRCAYFREPSVSCLKKGGPTCPARTGDALHLSAVDLGPCLSVHPSTLACALYAYDATVHVLGSPSRPVAALYGDGRDPTREHLLPAGAVLVAVEVPAPVEGERATYLRLASRSRAEWPLVEMVVRVAPGFARVAVGGLAPVPFRLDAVETALGAGEPWADVLARTTSAWTLNAPAAWRVGLLQPALTTALERLA
jgi:xanthine dehydrogenase YagS FAD-binding subunit